MSGAETEEQSEIVQGAGLRFATIRSASVVAGASARLDAKYYQEEFTLAKARVYQCGLPVRLVSEFAKAFVPGRAKLVTVPHESAGAPYLKAHDAFMMFPESDRYVAATRMSDYDSYVLKEGMILTPSSGRNLGPTAYVGKSMTKYAMTDIMRIVPSEETSYLLTYLRTPLGQALIRRGRTGTNVDHLSPAEVLEIPVVWPEENHREAFSKIMDNSLRALEWARVEMEEVDTELKKLTGIASFAGLDGLHSYGVQRNSLSLRIDAAYYSEDARKTKREIQRGKHSRLGDIADLRMLGRYKRYYVGRDYGRPILSGTHLLQLFPVNLKCISDRSFSDPSAFVLKEGWTIFTCDGRAEEGLGSPAFVGSMWDEWMASNHVMRAMPKDVEPGYLYAGLRLPHVQQQLKVCATGSVIDALDPSTVADVLIPRVDDADEKRLGRKVEKAWNTIGDCVRLDSQAVSTLTAFLIQAYEGKS